MSVSCYPNYSSIGLVLVSLVIFLKPEMISVRSVQAVSAAAYYQIRTLSILKPRTRIAAITFFEAGNDFGQIGPAVSGGLVSPRAVSARPVSAWAVSAWGVHILSTLKPADWSGQS